MPGAATMAVAAARAAAQAPRNSRTRLRRRPSGGAGGPFMDGFLLHAGSWSTGKCQVTASDLLDGF
jgi:hypothetical protein